MPPQSRGNDADGRSYSAPGVLPPTLKPFLETGPPPTPLTPTRSAPVHAHLERDGEDTTSTPVRLTFELDAEEAQDEDDDDEDDDDQDDDQDGQPDDDDFESHYSRKSSPAASDNGSEEMDIVEMTLRATSTGNTIHRISSLPGGMHHSGTGSGLQLSYSTTSLPRPAPPIPPPLYPPFYNRPPTPLLPSPSLTSLLRPPSLLNRSATSTRPTTPDSSDAETPNDTEAAVAHSARKAQPLPPTSPKVPTYEYYGFVLYLASTLAFLMYMFWSYLPSPFLRALGITYYPNRWWSLAIPAWIVMLLIYIYVALACWNVEYLTLGFSSVETMVDDAGNVAILDEHGRIKKGGSKRLEWDLEERKKREKFSASWSRKGKGSSGRKKDRRKKSRDEAESHRFGYMGDVYEGRVASGLSWRQIWNEGTDAVMDVPVGGVCEVLYGEGRDNLL